METLSHIPLWVAVLFIGLVVLGLLQAKDRQVPLWRAAILPVAMMAYSLYGVISSFGLSVITIGLWLLGIAIAFGINRALQYPRHVVYRPEKKIYGLRGSFIPMILIMLIFWTKFLVGFGKGVHWDMVNTVGFTGAVSLSLGVFSGMFVAGGWRLFVLRRSNVTQDQ